MADEKKKETMVQILEGPTLHPCYSNCFLHLCYYYYCSYCYQIYLYHLAAHPLKLNLPTRFCDCCSSASPVHFRTTFTSDIEKSFVHVHQQYGLCTFMNGHPIIKMIFFFLTKKKQIANIYMNLVTLGFDPIQLHNRL